MAMVAGPAAPQIVLCGMVVNPDGTVAGAGPLGQLPAGALGNGALGNMQGMAPGPLNSNSNSMLPDPTVVAAWGAATMMGKGMPGMTGYEMLPSKGGKGMQHMKGTPTWDASGQGLSQQPFYSKSSPNRGKGRNLDPPSENDWDSIGRQRQQKDAGVRQQAVGKAGVHTDRADSKTSAGTSVSTDDAAEAKEGLGALDQGHEKMVNTLKDLKLKVEKPVMQPRSAQRDEDNDWAMAVPEEELAWHNEAAVAAKKCSEEETKPVLTTAQAIALAQGQAEERERQARRQVSQKPSDDCEARTDEDGSAEEYRTQRADQARQERQRELAQIELQDQRAAERDARLKAREDAPKLTWSQARALKMQQ